MRLPEKIAHLLEKSILKGEFSSGTRFPPERELAERYEVSRSTIREAVGKLAQLGLVETLPQSGTYVTNYLVDGSLDLLLHLMKSSETVDSDVVLSLMEFRRMAEIFAVEKAVHNASDTDVEALAGIVDRESAPSAGPQQMADCDYAFHYDIIRLSRNLVLQLVFNSFKPVYRFYTDFFFNLPGVIPVAVSQHRQLLKAFKRRDADLAVSAMGEALRYGEGRVGEELGIFRRRRDISLNGSVLSEGLSGE
jgi:GntR family transcriptional repressor for pyruvate dehydrogenase complex